MKMIARFVLVAAVMSLLPVSAAASTLPVGSHKLEWVLPPPNEKQANQPPDCCLPSISFSGQFTLMPAACKIAGAVSSKVLAYPPRPAGRSRVAVVDESKGTGTGYDSLYIVPFDSAKSSVIDLARARKISVAVHESTQSNGNGIAASWLEMLDDPKDVIIDVPFGKGKNEVIKKVGVDAVKLYLKLNGVYISPPFSFIHFRGRWTSTVSTDQGSFTFTSMGGEVYLLASTKEGTTHMGMHAGKRYSFGGELYVANINDVGDWITIKRYEGAAGSIRVEALDGFGKPIAVAGSQVQGDGVAYSVNDKEDTKVPPGDYRYDITIAMPAGTSGYPVSMHGDARVEPGQTKIIAVGGPVRVIADPDENEIIYTQGAGKAVALAPSINGLNAKISFPDNKMNMSLVIKDGKGGIVWTGVPIRWGFVNNRGVEFSVELPKTLAPGKYTLFTTADLPGYQNPVTTEKTVVVTPS
ncbi:MAG: hypothetical protein Q7T82_02090 [Armatimonadota bacterium]|nr:hypothetical protein [Armatimonadota bacterium]